MEILVRFFAAYRELAGLRETEVELPSGATAADLVDRILEVYPKLAGHRQAMILAVNQEFVELDAPLRAGDEVALLPPVSGGGETLCRIQSGPIDPERVLEIVRNDRAGAVVLFLGTVRADPGVVALDYEAYGPMAAKKFEEIRIVAKDKFGITEMAIVHRTGRLSVGEISVAIACSAPHRQAAFRACEWAMEELKKIVPIWKAER